MKLLILKKNIMKLLIDVSTGWGEQRSGEIDGKQRFVSCGGETRNGSSFCFWSHSHS
jgi:hypothetical protein